jgi:hypothetical protein
LLLVALEAMRGEALLYLHYVGGRYRFEPRANLNRLIQQEQERVGREEVRERVRGRLEATLGASGPERRHVVLWPATPADAPDEGDVFRVVYLPPEWSPSDVPLERWVLLGSSGPRVNRNALCLVEPDSGRFDAARSAGRRELAIEALLAGQTQLLPEQREELRDRLKTAEGDVRSALGHACVRVQVPVGLADDGSLRFSSRELATILAAGRPLHERVREALETHVAVKLYPAKVAALAQLGAEHEWRWVREVAQSLPRFLEAPKVWTPEALALGIADGVQQGAFGYAAAATPDGGALTVPSPSAIRLRELISADLVELGGDAALLTVALAEQLGAAAEAPTPTAGAGKPFEPGTTRAPETAASSSSGAEANGLRLEITATEDDLFALNQSLSKLRDLLDGGSMQLKLTVDAQAAQGTALDRVRTRNVVIEPLEERHRVEVEPQWLDPSD